MSYYTLALYVWSSIAAAGVAAPLVAFVARETRKTIDSLRRDAVESSPAPFSHASAPSHPGY